MKRIEMRSQLLGMMSDWSERNYSISWIRGLDQTLYVMGGTWEILGKELWWPIGYRGDQGWAPWEQAGQIYTEIKAREGIE